MNLYFISKNVASYATSYVNISNINTTWAAAITELGGLTYLLVENQVKKKWLIESILLSNRIYKQAKIQRRKPRILISKSHLKIRRITSTEKDDSSML